MSRFLGLPLEVRTIIYREVAAHEQVKYIAATNKRGVKSAELSTSGALLVCCKQVNNEFKSIFYEGARVDITTQIDMTTGKIDLSVEPGIIRHVKITQSGAAVVGLLRALSNLKSFTFTSAGSYWIPDCLEEWSDDGLWERDDECCCAECGYDKRLLSWLQSHTNEFPNLLVGKCQCEEEYYCDDDGCWGGNHPIRKVIGVWEFQEAPFKLICEVALDEDVRGNHLVSPVVMLIHCG